MNIVVIYSIDTFDTIYENRRERNFSVEVPRFLESEDARLIRR